MVVRPGPVRPRLAARNIDAALVAVGALSAVLVAVIAVVIAATPGIDAAELWATVLVAAVFIGAGLVAWSRRPHNRCGLLMIGSGLAFAVAGLQGVSIPALDTIGLLAETVPLAMTLHVLMAYPSGRLASRSSLIVVVAGYVVAVLPQLPLRITPSPVVHTAATLLQGVHPPAEHDVPRGLAAGRRPVRGRLRSPWCAGDRAGRRGRHHPVREQELVG